MKLSDSPESVSLELADRVAAAVGGAKAPDVLEVAVALVVETAIGAGIPRTFVNHMIDVMWNRPRGS